MHEIHVLYDTCNTHVIDDAYSSIQNMYRISRSYHQVFLGTVIIFNLSTSIQSSTLTGTNAITHTHLNTHPRTHSSAYVTRHHKVSQICLHMQGIFDCNRGGGSPMYIYNNNNNIIIYFICKAQFKYKTYSFHSFSLRGSVTNSHMIVNSINKLVKKLSE